MKRILRIFILFIIVLSSFLIKEVYAWTNEDEEKVYKREMYAASEALDAIEDESVAGKYAAAYRVVIHQEGRVVYREDSWTRYIDTEGKYNTGGDHRTEIDLSNMALDKNKEIAVYCFYKRPGLTAENDPDDKDYDSSKPEKKYGAYILPYDVTCYHWNKNKRIYNPSYDPDKSATSRWTDEKVYLTDDRTKLIKVKPNGNESTEKTYDGGWISGIKESITNAWDQPNNNIAVR